MTSGFARVRSVIGEPLVAQDGAVTLPGPGAYLIELSR
jgi:hypothetical protein